MTALILGGPLGAFVALLVSLTVTYSPAKPERGGS